MRRLDNHIQPFLSSSSSPSSFSSSLSCRCFPSLGSAWSPVGAARFFVSFFILSLAAHPLALVLPPAGRPAAAAALLPRAGGSTTRRAVSSGKLSFGAQIGCIVGAYVGALLIVGLLILKFSRTRRRTLRGGLQGAPQERHEQRHRSRWRRTSDLKASFPARPPAAAFTLGRKPHPQSPTHVRNFSYPSPNTPPEDPYQQQKNTNSAARTRGPAGQVDQITSIPWGPSVCLTPVADPLAEQREVMSSRREASDQLADLYRLVLEQDDERAGQPRQGPQQQQQRSPTELTGGGRDAAALAALAAPPRPPSLPLPPQPKSSEKQPGRGLLRRGKSKPADLPLDKDKGARPTSTPTSAGEKRKSRGGALLSALLSPKRRTKVLSISSPLMTPKSAAAAGHPAEQEMHPLTPRHYVPMPPPPVPGGGGGATPLTPDQSPAGSPRDDAASSIDGRLSAPPALPQLASRSSKASLLQRTQTHEAEEKEEGGAGPMAQGRAGQDEANSEPQSIEARLGLADAPLSSPATTPVGDGGASQPLLGSSSSQASSPTTSVRAQSPPVGLPQSPRSGTRFSGLPQSPKPGSTFQPTLAAVPPTPEQQQKQPQNSQGPSQSAVRPGGTLALRAYEPSGAEVTSSSLHFKQTVFERMLSPATSPGSDGGDSGGGGPPRTGGPFTPGPVPYTPYQPKTPLFPMSPTLVTKEDRKRMKKMEPKTPVTEMVKSTDEIW